MEIGMLALMAPSLYVYKVYFIQFNYIFLYGLYYSEKKANYVQLNFHKFNVIFKKLTSSNE